MRTWTTKQERAYDSSSPSVLAKIEIQDDSGTMQDWTSLEGGVAVLSMEWKENPEKAAEAWIGATEFVANYEGVNEFADARDRRSIGDLLGELDRSLGDNTEATRENTAAMRNVPEIFQAALRTGQASAGAGMDFSSLSPIAETAERRRNQVQTGSPVGTGLPFAMT